nr:tyrosine-type recombinase/integrase [uncultured Methanobacterium sp.]
MQRGRRRKVEGLKDPKIRANLTKDDISQLIGVCKSFKMKAVILAQASSGLAISDLLNLKLSDFKEGIQKVYDDNDEPCRICQLSLERKKTHVKFTTFFSEEAVEAIETYLEFERLDVNDDGALFSRYQSGGNHMSTMAIQHSYRELNRFLGWVPDEGGFYKATSHMMRKFFNTQLINAGMPWEIREHMMGHKLKDRVREAYFLADPEELKKVYLRYIEHLTVKDSTSGKYSQDEFRELQRQNSRLCDTVAEMKKELKELKGEV